MSSSPEASVSPQAGPSGCNDTSGAAGSTAKKRPVACIVLGMAGSGKTTLMQRLNSHLHQRKTPYYLINLDPAVLDTPFGANIDIRDTVNYREVMRQYQLGPNGGILTSLNLFATRFEDVMRLVEARAPSLDYVLLDTPGQIEIFTWSASGSIISESLASSMPTVIVYVVDTPRCASAVTFMSNMLYACSILYKAKLPLLLVFNKTDVTPHDFAQRWMTDLDAFREALQAEKSYMGTLATSMALMLEEFYSGLTTVGLSARTGVGVDAFFDAVQVAAQEYESTYAEELRTRRAQAAAAESARRDADTAAFQQDRLSAAGARVVLGGNEGPGGAGTAARGGAFTQDEGSDEEEGWGEEDEGGAGYNKGDEEWAREHETDAADREELESLSRYLNRRAEDRQGRGQEEA